MTGGSVVSIGDRNGEAVVTTERRSTWRGSERGAGGI
jgi:hypothetical protein